MRKFEKVNERAILPVRATGRSAGYDFFVLDDVVISPWKPTWVCTGVKAQMEEDEYLQLSLRSSAPGKFRLTLANGVGIVDSDYYNNSDNGGHIMFNVLNFGAAICVLPAGTRIGQGVFGKYLRTVDDEVSVIRSGGLGSTS